VAGALVLLLLASPGPVRAAGEYRTVDVEGLKITIDSTWGGRLATGYMPVRFEVANTGEARVIEIAAYGTRFFRSVRGSQPGGSVVRQQVRLARNDRVRLTIPLPILADNENVRFEIREDGRVLERFAYVGFQGRLPPANAAVLIVADSASAVGKVATSWLRTAKPLSGSGTLVGRPTPVLDFVLEPSRLPANWLGYTSLRAVFLGPAEWRLLDDAQKAALLDWTAAGGDLFYVDGTVAELVPGLTEPASAELRVRAYLLGRIHLPASLSITSLGVANVLAAAAKTQDSTWSLPVNGAADWNAIGPRGFRLDIPGVVGVPARTYVSILLVFSILVGPVNYWWLRRRGRQVLLVLTAPLISLLFIVVLGGYVIAGEGIGVRGRAATFTMLDQARRQAATRASVSLYAAGMSPSGGLRFARDVAVFPLGRDGNGPRDSQALDLTDAQRYASGAIQARFPTNFEEALVRPARERLTVARDGGRLAVTNGLGATNTTLLYRESGRVYHLSRPLPAGDSAPLTEGRLQPDQVVPGDLPLAARLRFVVEHQPEGSYLAVLERSLFWDPGVPDVLERGSFHFVLGWPGGQP
jgi:hypothetical protein